VTTTAAAHSDMSSDDARHWQAVQDWKAKRFSPPGRRLLPETWRKKAHEISDQAKERAGEAAGKVPGAERFADLLAQALQGLTGAGARAGAATVRTDAILKAYRKRGHDVSTLADVRRLDVNDILATKPRLDLAYITGSAAQGAGTGLLASGGTIIAAGGAVGAGGVGVAPGAATIVGAMAADAAATIVASNRAVAHVAAYYGYDVDEPSERMFALGALSMGLAEDAGKLAAYRELNKIVQALARRQTWKQLSTNQVTRVVQAVYASLGMRLTQRRLAQAVPVVGIVVGAGLNARALARVVDDAEHLYLERFLREKYGLAIESDDDAQGALLDIVDAEIVDED
jgi:hypothetical protein